MRRTFVPSLFFTGVLLCMRVIIESFSHRASEFLNVRIFMSVASVRNCNSFWPCLNVTLSPRSFGLTLLMLFSVMNVSSRIFANPSGSSSGLFCSPPRSVTGAMEF